MIHLVCHSQIQVIHADYEVWWCPYCRCEVYDLDDVQVIRVTPTTYERIIPD